MANRARGEVVLEVGDRKFHLVPSYATFAEIEDATGLGAYEAMARLEAGSVKVVVEMLSAASKLADGEAAMTRDEISTLLLESGGIGPVWPQLYLFVAQTTAGFRRTQELVDQSKAQGEDPAPPSGKSADAPPVG